MWILYVCLAIYVVVGLIIGYGTAVATVKEEIEEDGANICVEGIVLATIVVTFLEIAFWPLDVFYSQVIRRIVKAATK